MWLKVIMIALWYHTSSRLVSLSCIGIEIEGSIELIENELLVGLA